MYRLGVRGGGTGAIWSRVVTSVVLWYIMFPSFNVQSLMLCTTLFQLMHLRVASILGLLLLSIPSLLNCICMYPATCREAVWSPCGHCCVVVAMWAKSGNAESIIGGKMANVLDREENLEQVTDTSFYSNSNS